MLGTWFEMGGPVMWALLGAWAVVAGTCLDRALYWLGAALRQPLLRLNSLARREGPERARRAFEEELLRARRGLDRIDSVSQLATSLGLFGTVLGIARAFFGRGGEAGVDPEVLGSSLATALFTTIAGLAVFLVGQLALALLQELESAWTERARRILGPEVLP